MQTAETLKRVTEELHLPFYFKSSYDKANRTSLSCRGIGMEEGLNAPSLAADRLAVPPVLFGAFAHAVLGAWTPPSPWSVLVTSLFLTLGEASFGSIDLRPPGSTAYPSP